MVLLFALFLKIAAFPKIYERGWGYCFWEKFLQKEHTSPNFSRSAGGRFSDFYVWAIMEASSEMRGLHKHVVFKAEKVKRRKREWKSWCYEMALNSFLLFVFSLFFFFNLSNLECAVFNNASLFSRWFSINSYYLVECYCLLNHFCWMKNRIDILQILQSQAREREEVWRGKL